MSGLPDHDGSQRVNQCSACHALGIAPENEANVHRRLAGGLAATAKLYRRTMFAVSDADNASERALEVVEWYAPGEKAGMARRIAALLLDAAAEYEAMEGKR